MARKPLGTPVDETIKNEFKIKCKSLGFEMNEILEILMKSFINDEIHIQKEISYNIHQKDN